MILDIPNLFSNSLLSNKNKYHWSDQYANTYNHIFTTIWLEHYDKIINTGYTGSIYTAKDIKVVLFIIAISNLAKYNITNKIYTIFEHRNIGNIERPTHLYTRIPFSSCKQLISFNILCQYYIYLLAIVSNHSEKTRITNSMTTRGQKKLIKRRWNS